MKFKYIGIGVLIITFVGYFWVLPSIKDHLSDRNIENIEREKKEAQKEVELARLKEEAKMKNLCTASQVDNLTNSKTKSDGGSKPHAKAKATINAKKDYFIFEPSIKTTHVGTTGFRKGKRSSVPHPKYKGTIFDNSILSSASYTVNCSKGQNIAKLGTNTCRASANITAIQYSIKCVDYLADKANK